MSITNQIPSIVRWLLALLGASMTFKGAENFQLDTMSIMQLVTGAIAMALSFALKKANEIGGNGKLAAMFIGPKVQNYSESIARWLIAIAAGLAVQYVNTDADHIANADLTEIIIVAGSFIFDRVFKKIKP